MRSIRPTITWSATTRRSQACYSPPSCWCRLRRRDRVSGFLFERFRKLCGSGRAADTVMVPLAPPCSERSTTRFRLAGVEQAVITGSCSGVISRSPAGSGWWMVAHAAFDLTALAIIYWNPRSKSGAPGVQVARWQSPGNRDSILAVPNDDAEEGDRDGTAPSQPAGVGPVLIHQRDLPDLLFRDGTRRDLIPADDCCVPRIRDWEPGAWRP